MDAVIPFVDLPADWKPLKRSVLARVERLLEHGQFIMGPEVAELETRLAQSTGVNHALTCSSGTMALQLALMALGVGLGDEVIVPTFTFAAPVEAILLLGAKPVLADIRADTLNIDVSACAALIGPRTKAIIAVSLFGEPADFSALNSLARAHGLSVIEDAAQSYGSSLNGQPSGSLADIGCTSFFPTKPLGGAGEGGALFTNDNHLAQRLREARDHGQSGKYLHTSLGTNGRLDSLSCCALLAVLEHLPERIDQRRAVAERYRTALINTCTEEQLRLPTQLVGTQSAHAQFAVLLPNREIVAEHMRSQGIQTAVHYPIPLHLQPAFVERCRFGTLENAEAAAQQILCLPIYPTLGITAQERVIETLLQGIEKCLS